jgi:pimeloyl-ACP methyl ester carboxylesterase
VLLVEDGFPTVQANESDGRSTLVGPKGAQARLRFLRIPTLIVHGLSDPLVSASGGLARSIPGATFTGHQGMGHDLPRTLWPALVTDILSLVGRADT